MKNENKRSPRPRKATLAVLAIVVILIPVALAFTLIENLSPVFPAVGNGGNVTATQQQTSSQSTSMLAETSGSGSASCASPENYTGLDSVAPSSSNFSKSFGMFSMPQDGGGRILCVTFYDTYPDIASMVNLNATVKIGNFATQAYANGTVDHTFVSTPAITVTPMQQQLVLGGSSGLSKATIAFVIDSSSTSKGFYYLNIQSLSPEECDDEFRFAVGYTFVGSNATGHYFSLPPGVGACTSSVPTIFTQVEGVEGMQITYLSCDSFTCDIVNQ